MACSVGNATIGTRAVDSEEICLSELEDGQKRLERLFYNLSQNREAREIKLQQQISEFSDGWQEKMKVISEKMEHIANTLGNMQLQLNDKNEKLRLDEESISDVSEELNIKSQQITKPILGQIEKDKLDIVVVPKFDLDRKSCDCATNLEDVIAQTHAHIDTTPDIIKGGVALFDNVEKITGSGVKKRTPAQYHIFNLGDTSPAILPQILGIFEMQLKVKARMKAEVSILLSSFEYFDDEYWPPPVVLSLSPHDFPCLDFTFRYALVFAVVDEIEVIYKWVSIRKKLQDREVRIILLIKWLLFLCVLGGLIASLILYNLLELVHTSLIKVAYSGRSVYYGGTWITSVVEQEDDELLCEFDSRSKYEYLSGGVILMGSLQHSLSKLIEHREKKVDGENTVDISYDHTKLERTFIMVVSASVKSILDISRTQEYFDCVAAYQTNELSIFLIEKSGHKETCQVDSAEVFARLIDVNINLKLQNRILVAVTIPGEICIKTLCSNGKIDGEKCQEQRKVVSYAFSTRVLKDFSKLVFKNNVVKLANIAYEVVNSTKSMDIQNLFMKGTLDSISEVAFELKHEHSSPICEAFKYIRECPHWDMQSDACRRIVEAQMKEALLSGVALVEKKRRITIATKHIECENVKRHYAHEDYLWHADYVKNISIGAAQMDGGILVVSTPDAPMPRTKVHILLACQVGVPSLVCFLNKVGVVYYNPKLLELIEMKLHELHSIYKFPGDEILIVQGSVLFALEDDITIQRYDTVATGRVVQETIKQGKEVELLEFEMFKKTLVSIWVGNLNFGLPWQYYAAKNVLKNFKLDNFYLTSCVKGGAMQLWYGIIFNLDPWGQGSQNRGGIVMYLLIVKEGFEKNKEDGQLDLFMGLLHVLIHKNISIKSYWALVFYSAAH